MFKFRKKNNRGFTLMELIVSIAIITTLIAIFLVNYRGGSRRTELIMTVQKMATDIRLAQNNTLGSVKYGAEIPEGGWGVHFDISSSGDDGSYLIFADLDGDSRYDDGEGEAGSGSRRIYLPREINIEGIDMGGSVEVVNVTFVPPDPETVIFNEGASATSSELTITLKESENNTTKDVYLNFFGLIEVLD